jgi:Bacterial Ig-like domain
MTQPVSVLKGSFTIGSGLLHRSGLKLIEAFVWEYAMRYPIAGMALAFAFATSACSDSTSPSTTGASLDAVSPTPGAMGVDPATVMTMHFSAAMQTSMMQYVDLHQGTIAGSVVPMTCSWSSDNTTLTCQPIQPLQHGTSYVLHMGGGMMNANGDPVDVEHYGMTIGGQPVSGGMMGGMHGGQGTGMMGGSWMDPDGHDGMEFTFTTA